ncbi:MAG: septal ring lytic transglycosylase RlpA family protein, partial [Cyanobacteria bacterium J06638_38]
RFNKMTIRQLKNIKLIPITILLTILNISLNHSGARAEIVDQDLESISSMPRLIEKTSKDHSLNLPELAAKIKSQAQQNDPELSQIDAKIPLSHRFLIANLFGGKASWYGPGFHGRLTANGERYNQNAMTAAHRSLKFGTRVKVTNLNNGRSVVVRINDRGPFIKGRVIDLSAAAARSLNMIHSGVAPVQVTILGQ